MGIKLKFSSAYHPETDGQTERVNQVLEQYLICFIDFEQANWVSLLPFAQFNYNSTLHSSIKMTPAEALMGINPTFVPGRNLGDCNPGVIQRLVDLRQARIKLKENLTIAVQNYTKHANKKRKDVEFNEDDYVYLSTSNLPLPYKAKKLAPKRVGPFKIITKLSRVSYRLQLPESWNIHNVFHISLLTKAPQSVLEMSNSIDLNSTIEDLVPERILDFKLRYGKPYFLIKWTGLNHEESTWEELTTLEKHAQMVQNYLNTRGYSLEGDNVRIL